MSKYTLTRDGFQHAMRWSLTGSPNDTKDYVEATVTPNFYHEMNGHKLMYDAYTESIAEWRGKISDYEPVVHEFLRDGDQLAARMTGEIKVDGTPTAFESFMFAKVEKESGKLEWLIERSVLGEVGKDWEHGVAK